MKLLTKTADRLVELILPRATASASTVVFLYCACMGHRKWYKACTIIKPDILRCGGCNVVSSTAC